MVVHFVILPSNFKHELLNDSKQLTEKQRQLLKPIIEKKALTFGIALVYQNEIDKLNNAGKLDSKITLSNNGLIGNGTLKYLTSTTISDNLDLLLPSDTFSKQITKSNNNDWYSIAGITVTYNFRSDKKWCPAYQQQRK